MGTERINEVLSTAIITFYMRWLLSSISSAASEPVRLQLVYLGLGFGLLRVE